MATTISHPERSDAAESPPGNTTDVQDDGTATTTMANTTASSTRPTTSNLPILLSIHGSPIYFREDWAAGVGGGLWSTGLAMAYYLQSTHAQRQLHRLYDKKKKNHPNNNPQNRIIRNNGNHRTETARRKLNVLELGSGNGLLATCWLALAKQQQQPGRPETENHDDETSPSSSSSWSWIENLVVTDTHEHLPLIRQTLEANPHLWNNNQDGNSPNVHILPHYWGEFHSDDAKTSSTDAQPATTTTTTMVVEDLDYDLIIGSDVAYHERLYNPLIASLRYFCTKKQQRQSAPSSRTTVLLGCTMSDTGSDFFDRLRDAGFAYQRIQDHHLAAEYRGGTFGLFVVQPTTTLRQQQSPSW
mmetsp:Transcript_15988/g.44008  ORF Transcript_15988/g.44008 Transcript_15988/m.44008 type:complete len:358 (-) Transcript_15988:45-1118(-)